MDPADDKTPRGPTFDSEKIKREAEKRLQRSKSLFSGWRTLCARFFATYANDPWEPGDKAAMQQDGRPAVTFNYALSTINTVVGADMADRKEAQYQGQDGDLQDETIAEWYTILLRWIYQRCRGHRHESAAQLDQLITGYGWTECFVDSSCFPFRISMRHVDCGRMLVDPDYKQDNCLDARYLFCSAKWEREDVIARWPDKESVIGGAPAQDQLVFPKVAAANNYGTVETAGGDVPDIDGDYVRVYDYQFRRKEQWVAFDDPESGEQRELPASEFTALKNKLMEQRDPRTGQTTVPEIHSAPFARDVFYRAFYAGGLGGDGLVELEGPKRIMEDSFTYTCATAFREKDFTTDRTRHFGLMALIYEPQMWSAKTLSTIIEMLSRSAKGGGFIKAGTLKNPAGFITGQGQPGKWWLANDEANFSQDIYERNAVSFPQGLERLLDIATNGIPQLTGITDYLKGTARQERSNVLVSNLQGQSMNLLNPVMDPLSQSRIDRAILIGKLIQRYMSSRDINRVIGEVEVVGVTHQEAPPDPTTGVAPRDPATGKAQIVPIMVQDENAEGGQRPITPADIIRDEGIFDFDIVVDLGAASVTAKQSVWQLFTQTGLLSKLMEAGFPMQELFPFLIRNTPGIPTEQAKALSDKIKGQMEQQAAMQTTEGITTALQGLPPDQLGQINAALQQILQQQGGPPPGEPNQAPPEAAPVQ